MDNRSKDKSNALEEIENDTTPIDEGEQAPKDGEEDLDENGKPIVKAEGDDLEPEDEEDILLDDEEIDEDTGEIKKKVAPVAPVKQKLPEEEERYRAQQRESIIVNERNRQLTDTFSKIDEVKEPTPEELQQSAQSQGFDWEELSNVEKSLFKSNYINNQKLAIVNNAVRGVKDIDEWAGTVDTFLEENTTKQTNKSLIGKEAEFRAFAMKSTHRGVSIAVLTSAFLHEYPEQRRQHGSIMLTRTGGDRVEKVDKTKDADYIANLRKSNPREYSRLARAGKVNIEL